MIERPLTDTERARNALSDTRTLSVAAAEMDWEDAGALEAMALRVDDTTRALNGAAQRMRRIAKQLKKRGVAGASKNTK